jgi:hypothetical protein
MFLRNIGWLSTDYTGVIFQETELFIITAVRTSHSTNPLELTHTNQRDNTWIIEVHLCVRSVDCVLLSKYVTQRDQ